MGTLCAGPPLPRHHPHGDPGPCHTAAHYREPGLGLRSLPHSPDVSRQRRTAPPYRRTAMNICETCCRQRDGASNCRGCRTGYRPLLPSDQVMISTPYDDRTQSDERIAQPVREDGALRTSVDGASAVIEGPHPTPPARFRRWRVTAFSAGLVLCTTIVVMFAAGLTSYSDAPQASTVVSTGVPTPHVASAARMTPATTPSLTLRPAPRVEGSTGPTGSGSDPSISPTGRPGATVQASATGVAPPPSILTPTVTASHYPDTVVSSSGLCLTSGQDTAYGGTSVVLAPCTGVAGERWKVSRSGSVFNLAENRCMDVVDGGRDGGSVVQLFTCNSTPAQNWSSNGLQEIINPISGRCLDARDLTIRDCTGAASQRWAIA
jgi:hypothetical protein